MQRMMTTIAVLGTFGALLGTTGCNDQLKAKEAQLALIEDANRRLTEDLANSQQTIDELNRQRSSLNQQLLAAHGDLSRLQGELANQPEPAVPDGWQAVPGGAMIAIEGSVLFASGKPDLRAEGKTALDAIASAIQGQYEQKDIFVFGHTDDQPIVKSGWKDNFELSAQRALSVVRHLAERNISPSRLVACGAGEHRPRVPNSGASNRASNRRVEIFAVEPIK